ncbi:FAD-dependent oxidoreductase [Streptomyces sennicomposti]|uniref:FAD-dependent oxidoreductase n=1 Tax=Streptomyces sennicomposti TaxID=2873384 RepID=UPI001CA64CCA|nr:NAD(P)/FAD-dependent oxidoreductase [Streptomyces sennicomposti]MBY8867929.1 FAD-dependent monooxygenase [Streptomyces sennicomposti]
MNTTDVKRAPRIAVVGGGLGGLALAGMLHRQGIAATVYERDAGRAARTQGGTLDLHPESGQRALDELGLTEAFRADARPEGEELRILDPAGRTLVHRVPEPGGGSRPEIDRGVLRELLLSRVPDEAVSWGRRLTGVEGLPDGGHRLEFADGGHADCDILVGADGARSRVRPLLTDARPVHLSAYLQLAITDADRRRPRVAEFVGPGSLMALGDNLNLGAQRSGDGTIRVSVTTRVDADWVDRQGFGDAEWGDVVARLHELFAGWDTGLTSLIGACDPGSLVGRNIEALPVGTRWPSRPDVTLLGDAAHLMPPVGEGANQAMLDGVLLARAFAQHRDDPAAAIAAYETEMFDRAAVIGAKSARIESMGLAPDAAERLASYFNRMTAAS